MTLTYCNKQHAQLNVQYHGEKIHISESQQDDKLPDQEEAIVIL